MVQLKNKTETIRHYYNMEADGDAHTVRIEIIFSNHEFERANYTLSGTYTINEWRIVAAIAAEIETLIKIHDIKKEIERDGKRD